MTEKLICDLCHEPITKEQLKIEQRYADKDDLCFCSASKEILRLKKEVKKWKYAFECQAYGQR